MNRLLIKDFFLIAAMLYTFLGLYIYINDWNNVNKRIIFILSIEFAIWCFCISQMQSTLDIDRALFWRKASIFSWVLSYPTVLHLLSNLFNGKHRVANLGLVLLYAPGVFIVLLYYFVAPYRPYNLVLTAYGWAFNNTYGFSLDSYLFLYYGPYTLIAYYIAHQAKKNTIYKRDKYAYNYIIISLLIGVFIGLITDIVIPLCHLFKIVPLGGLAGLIFVFSLVYVTNKYGFLNINSPKVIADVLNNIGEGIILIDAFDCITYLNKGVYDTLHITAREEFVGKKFPECLLNHLKKNNLRLIANSNIILKNKSNPEKYIAYSKTTIKDEFEELYGTMYLFSDVTPLKISEKKLETVNRHLEESVKNRTNELLIKTSELANKNALLKNEIKNRKQMQEDICKFAYYDLLTNLYNRNKFIGELNRHFKLSKYTKSKHAVICFDIDNFKIINDNLGYKFGDTILRKIADTIIEQSDEKTILSRLGSDEFSVCLIDITEKSDIINYIENLYLAIAKPYISQSISVNISLSAGIAIYPTDGLAPEKLIGNADIALRESKKISKKSYHFFEERYQTAIESHFSMMNDLKAGIVRQEFLLHFQPQVTHVNGQYKITGFESLIRWQSKERGFVSPNAFIPIAEKSNQIIEIGRFVIKKSIEEISLFNKKFSKKLNISINLSGKQFLDEALNKQIAFSILTTGIAPNLIELEVTESVLVQDIDKAIQVLNELKALGIKIVVDDFGTVYSSLNYLKMLPIDKIKLDMSFVKGIGKSKKDEAILESLIFLAKRLELEILAEGVETKEQLDFLINKGCQQIQGYYFYKPLNNTKMYDTSVVKNCQ